MDETDGKGEIEVIVETESVDVDDDGVVDAVREVTTTVVDIDGDGVADIIEQTTITSYDIDGDGVPDIIEATTITGVDVDGDGSIGEDEITIEETVAIREDLVDDGNTPA